MDWRAALLARASGLAGGRFYWGERPQGSAMPAGLLTLISDDRPQHLKGYSLSPGRVQIDTYGKTPKEAWDLAEASVSAFVPGGAFNGHNFSRADIALGPRDMNERIGNETVFRVSMDLVFHHAAIEEGS